MNNDLSYIVGYIEENFGEDIIEEYLSGTENEIDEYLQEKELSPEDIGRIDHVLEFNADSAIKKDIEDFNVFLQPNK
jgi:hypothetical protein